MGSRSKECNEREQIIRERKIREQTEEGEAARDDKNCFYVSCWEYQGEDKDPVKYTEPLKYEAIEVKTRNYKS